MWFLNGRPSKINVDALLKSVSGGYQNTTFRFTVEKSPPGTRWVKKPQDPIEDENGELVEQEPLLVEEIVEDDDRMFLAIAFPWCSNRENGSLNIMKPDEKYAQYLDKLCPAENVTILQRDDVEIWERLRSLKMYEGVELALAQEMITWYIDDIGVMTLWIESGKTYQISYSHKIAADSKLFLPTRLPVFINRKSVQMNYRLWTIDAMVHEVPKFLTRCVVTDQERAVLPDLDSHSLHRLDFKDWDWEDDTRINTDNWESTDDEAWSSSEDEEDQVEKVTKAVADTDISTSE